MKFEEIEKDKKIEELKNFLKENLKDYEKYIEKIEISKEYNRHSGNEYFSRSNEYKIRNIIIRTKNNIGSVNFEFVTEGNNKRIKTGMVRIDDFNYKTKILKLSNAINLIKEKLDKKIDSYLSQEKTNKVKNKLEKYIRQILNYKDVLYTNDKSIKVILNLNELLNIRSYKQVYINIDTNNINNSTISSNYEIEKEEYEKIIPYLDRFYRLLKKETKEQPTINYGDIKISQKFTMEGEQNKTIEIKDFSIFQWYKLKNRLNQELKIDSIYNNDLEMS